MIRTPEGSLGLKRELFSALVSRYRSSIRQLEDGMADLQKAANEETKSSVGDKYETGRAMVQLEIEKIGFQLSALLKFENVIAAAKPVALHSNAQLGSVVETSNGFYYLIYNGGQIEVANIRFICISLQSPLGKLLFGTSTGNVIHVNDRPMTVLDVF